jgi:WD40 repeat protein
MPLVAWVWDMQAVELHSVLIHITPVKCLSFSPSSPHLVITTGSPRFQVWIPTQATVYELSQDLSSSTISATKARWSSKSNKLILSDKTHAVIAFPGFEFFSMAEEPSSNYGQMDK